ncbi:prepilin-type cleavage/methylation domain-containing protein [Enterococcus sp. BWB1-3]|uniref:competence type IV pilus minor pilin ComGD n=1 Tax=Enterococcus sp. BWB1-3 TaxID=2787713 RepID=UPI001920A5E2|nr:competence type IV pilus minor pilin ComGD [Enterococcus sp. BWB1-3]MBL1228108.1 prepilin-type cleavage/methylation domain-containing protein [Enterococcus sp. BWB1-3]
MTDTRRINNCSGFTLIETLLVFVVAVSLISLSSLLVEKNISNFSTAQFFSSFEKQLLYTQQMAVVGAVDTEVYFSLEEQQFRFVTGSKEEALLLPEALAATGPAKIIFKKGTGNNGNLSKYSFKYSRKNQLIEFQFQMGSGKYVKKISEF